MKINGENVKDLDELAELVDDQMARALWSLYPPPFLLPHSVVGMGEIKKPFLAWLMSRDIDPLLAGTAAVSTLAAVVVPSVFAEPSELPATDRRRARLEEVSIENGPKTFSSRVRLSMRQREVQVSEQAATGEGVPHVTARATIEAVRGLVPQINLELRAAYTVGNRDESEKRVAIVVLGECAPSGDREYAGASSVRSLESEAVARATLAALNRRVDWDNGIPISSAAA